ncbi:MAG: hypothetical protein J5925_06410, partial [Clostridia bacterium]|nr:hypothetical protein [Clostridia bacterium]
MAIPALALVSSVAAAYSYSQSAAPAALLCALVLVPPRWRIPGKRSVFAFAAEIIILFGAVLRLAALGALVCAKHGGFA